MHMEKQMSLTMQQFDGKRSSFTTVAVFESDEVVSLCTSENCMD